MTDKGVRHVRPSMYAFMRENIENADTNTHKGTHTQTHPQLNAYTHEHEHEHKLIIFNSIQSFTTDPTPPIPFILGTALPPSPVVIAVPDLAFCSRTLTALSNEGLSGECLLLLEEMR